MVGLSELMLTVRAAEDHQSTSFKLAEVGKQAAGRGLAVGQGEIARDTKYHISRTAVRRERRLDSQTVGQLSRAP